MTDWREERLAEQPPELQVIAPDMYMQRRNIRQVHHEAADGMDAYTDWACECRRISIEEYHRTVVDDTLEGHAAKIDYIAMMTDVDIEEV